ncbi:MAG: hypothetical protein HY294_11430, partial [Candidatus Rokubacteria bacterium]|nr:hypothetical protein [Candidatus Rokubacteria bacterium]
MAGWGHVSAAAAGTISYIYDRKNQLNSIVDDQGNSATFLYDSVGNLLRVDRVNVGAALVAITLVTPGQDQAGDTLSIYGAGFDPSPGQDTVTINGVLATVVS